MFLLLSFPFLSTCLSNTNISSDLLRVALQFSLILPQGDQFITAQQLLLNPILVLQHSAEIKTVSNFLIVKASKCPTATLLYLFFLSSYSPVLHKLPFRASSLGLLVCRSLGAFKMPHLNTQNVEFISAQAPTVVSESHREVTLCLKMRQAALLSPGTEPGDWFSHRHFSVLWMSTMEEINPVLRPF